MGQKRRVLIVPVGKRLQVTLIRLVHPTRLPPLAPQVSEVKKLKSNPIQITTEVVLGTDTTETILTDGLTFEVNREAGTAALVGWYGNSPAGDLSIPTQVCDGVDTYRVTSLGRPKAADNDNATGTTQENAPLTSPEASATNTKDSRGGGSLVPYFLNR